MQLFHRYVPNENLEYELLILKNIFLFVLDYFLAYGKGGVTLNGRKLLKRESK